MFRPMLSPNEDPLRYPNFFKELRFPLLGSPKLDGIRGITRNGGVFSRTGKLIPSVQVQEDLGSLSDLDGELIIGDVTDFAVYNRTQSHVMSYDKPGDLKYYVFDRIEASLLNEPFWKRLLIAEGYIRDLNRPDLVFVQHTHLETVDDLLAYEDKCLEEGYEGVMLRDPLGRYKNGRGTFKEGLIYKLKRFSEAEGRLITVSEKMTNTNVLETNELGYAKRSTNADGMIPAGTVGVFHVLHEEEIVDVAPGNFTHAQLQEIWDNFDKYQDRLLKFRFMLHGQKDKLRHPRAVGFRDKMDI
jgi:DNA ligase-1